MVKNKKRTNYKHGKFVKTPVPHADISKYVSRQTGKEDDKKPRYRDQGSTMKFNKPKKNSGSPASPRNKYGKN